MLRVVGAGLPSTATRSLKQALELLLGGRCHHMHEVFTNLEDMPAWRAAIRGDEPDWRTFPPASSATVDWRASAFWRELSDAHPEAIVLLSTRSNQWRPGDGREPLCAALGLAVLDQPFPHTNTRAEWTQ